MEEKNKIKQKQMVLMFIGIAILVISITGITFAFFNYTKTGGANVIKTGNIEFNMTQGKTINLQNVFPITSSEALADNSNTSVCEIVITGRNTYAGGVEYLVSTVNATNTDVPVSILVNVESNGNGANDNLGTSDNDYFTNRNSYTTSHYKKLVDDSFTGNEDILVGYIASSASTDNSINGKITIRAYFDKNNIIITDTTEETNTGDKTVMSTSEWNALNSNGVSFQVRVEANEGKWVENPNTLYKAVKAMNLGIMNAATDFGTIASSDTTNHPYGVYQLVENGLTNPIYFFRGDHTVKNNVIFDNKCWLVVRTTETNSTRMIYNGTPVDGHCTTTEGYDTLISLYQSSSKNSDGNYDYSYTSKEGFTTLKTEFPYNVNYNNAKYVGYTYDNGVNSNMKNALEAWYEGAISSEAKAKIETSSYCNDTTIDTSFTSYTKYMPYTRAGANTPSVVCPNGANAISSKVGFLTIDEEIMAGRTWSTGMQDYLYNNSYWWLGSPYTFNSGGASVFVVYSAYSAGGSTNVYHGNHGLRPLVSILSNTAITEGDGSQLTPWRIG